MTMLKDRPRNTKTSTGRSPIAGPVIAFSLLVVACWATLLAVASPVSIDVPVLRSTSPGVGATARPDNLLLTFDRPVPAGLATVRMTDPYHREIDPGRPTHPDGRADTISVPIPKQKYAGTYSVAWSVPTNQLESVRGTFTFDLASRSPVQDAPQLATKPSTVVTVFHAVAQFGALAALALLVGAVFFVAVVWPAGAESTATRRLVTYAWFGLVVATLAVVVTFGPYAAKLPLTDAFDPGLLSGTFQSDTGATFLARLLVLALAGISIAQFMTSAPAETARERWLRGGAVLGCAVALAATWSFVGHSVLRWLAPLSLAVDVVHLTTMAVLGGGLVMFSGALRRKRVAAELPTMAPRFSRITLVCAGLLVVTGAYEIWQQVGGFDAVTTFSGWLWVGKLGLVVVLVGIGLAGRWWVRRRFVGPDSASDAEKRTAKRGPGAALLSRFRRLVVVEAGIAGLVLAVTTMLVVSQPARTAHAEESAGSSTVWQQTPPARLQFDTGGQDGQGWLDLVIVPAKIGENEVHVSVLDKRGAAARDGLTVTAVLNPPSQSDKPVPVQLTRMGTGYSAGSVTIPSPGQWELALTVQSADGKQHTSYGVVDVA